MEKEKEKGKDTFVIDMSSASGARNRGGGFRSPSYTVLRKDIPAEKEERKPKAALPKFEKPEPLPKKKPPTPAPAPAPAPLLDQPVRLPPVQPIAPKIVVTPKPEPEPEPEPDIETPRLYLPLPERFRAWIAENAEEGESAAHIRSKYTYEWVRDASRDARDARSSSRSSRDARAQDHVFGPIPDLNPMELGAGPIRKMQLEKRQMDFCLCMILQDSLPCTIKQVRNQLQKEGGHADVTDADWMETAKQLYEESRCEFGFTTAGVPFEVWF